MKLVLSTLLCLSLAACSKKSTPATTPDPATPTSSTEPGSAEPAAGTGEGTPCAQEIALVCPDDQIDACLKTPAEGDTHKCVAK